LTAPVANEQEQGYRIECSHGIYGWVFWNSIAIDPHEGGGTGKYSEFDDITDDNVCWQSFHSDNRRNLRLIVSSPHRPDKRGSDAYSRIARTRDPGGGLNRCSQFVDRHLKSRNIAFDHRNVLPASSTQARIEDEHYDCRFSGHWPREFRSKCRRRSRFRVVPPNSLDIKVYQSGFLSRVK